MPSARIERILPAEVRLSSATLDLMDYERRPGEVRLMSDVVDHQLVDVDGLRVVRAADLYLATLGRSLRLVGVDVGVGALVRRLGPARWRRTPATERVIDWAVIQPFGAPGTPLRLRESKHELHRLRPAELADLLEELGRSEQQQLLAALDPETAADALEEMQPKELVALLRQAPPEQAAALLAVMEPDEAVDALRDLDDDARGELLAHMPTPRATLLRRLLLYPETTAGGFMNPELIRAELSATVAEVRAQLADADDADAVAVVDERGALVDDLTVFQLFVAGEDARVRDLVTATEPASVAATADVGEVVDRFIAGRHGSIVVVDEDRRPLGRITADDVVDALVTGSWRSRWMPT